MDILTAIKGKIYPNQDLYTGDIFFAGRNVGGQLLKDIIDIESGALFSKQANGYQLIGHGKNEVNGRSKHETQLGATFHKIKKGEPFEGHYFVDNVRPYVNEKQKPYVRVRNRVGVTLVLK